MDGKECQAEKREIAGTMPMSDLMPGRVYRLRSKVRSEIIRLADGTLLISVLDNPPKKANLQT